MESFFRYIAYIDYYEKGLRIHNAGFLRWKMQKNRHQLELEVKDLGKTGGYFTIMEEGNETKVMDLFLEKGQGNLKKTFEAVEKRGRPCLKLSQGELDLYSIKAFRIDLGQERVLRIPLELPLTADEVSPMQLGTADADNVLIQGIQEKYEQSMVEEKKPQEIEIRAGHEEKAKEETQRESTKGAGEEKEEPKREKAIKSEGKREELPEEKERKIAAIEPEKRIHPPFEEDKWLELCKKYPQVHPFGGEKIFLSIKPEDFIILQERYQKLVHNSFLLHGYYNYQHMILGKLEEGKDKPYYLGVPGVFYEKERQAAGLFGFAGFEGTEIPVRNGSYGYYMIEVKI